MIKITDTYLVKVETNPVCYTLVRRRTSKPKDGGEPNATYANIGYYGSLQNALKGALDRVKADRLVDKNLKLSEAIEILREADDEIIAAIKDACPEYQISKET